ncbi:hypothetical protein CTEN210_04991 [Chaetoceros tenuissimus]|uniref:Uncharacterized protein n=1 Tax=Chaetoceros tenuissimus TaxID=426638 RepID=A0AAD3H310_9STRA|nr:hypothetical protein CTEN210_04991 [Chaetoceros tenuissimus]
MTRILSTALLLAAFPFLTSAFLPALSSHTKKTSALNYGKKLYDNEAITSRRNFFHASLQLLMLTQIKEPAFAAIEKVKPITPEEAETKFIEGYKTLCYLIDHYPEICEGGGDNVRRYLGTIVSTPPSGLIGIAKTMKALEDKADDFIEYTELADEIVKTINQADGSSYMAIFVTTSTSYTPPQKYFNDGLIEIKRCKKSMEELARMIDIKLS